ncbi:MAG: hypothetical protein ED556_09310 [Winogradskyella sp.]|uniref:DUF6428 family protein n=1 Tax=Winogradskyella sp. TaxID=1883156 RepID=UPI000F3E3EBD|nr:DUF6428 family protein [Winogradskyella sp.]RNC86474.1 MAG: hypothetical protein ED556_09310 [Winogradskyella sp.]
MKLSEIKQHLNNLSEIAFQLPDGSLVPRHFHVTEIGKISKTFIDCGGTLRQERVINFQLWEANDYDHRLHPEKLLNIINLSEDKLNLRDTEIEVEYQSNTIGKYDLGFSDGKFMLLAKQTDCLAKDNCGIPSQKPKLKLSELQSQAASCCAPDSGCC